MKRLNKIAGFVVLILGIVIVSTACTRSVFAEEMEFGVLDMTNPFVGPGGEHEGPIVGPGGENPNPEPAPAPEPQPEPTPVNPCANGHTFDGGTLIRPATCTEPGDTRYSCMLCNYAEERNEPAATGHSRNGGTIILPATCASDGIIQYNCILCGADMGTDIITKTDHVSDDGTVVQPSTCLASGIIEFKCIVCGTSLGTKEIPQLDHVSDGGTVVKQPTSIEPGKIEYKCVNCGIVLREEIIPAIKKRETPKAVFQTDLCILSNIPFNSTVAINGAVIESSASDAISLLHMFPLTGTYKITVVANDTATESESDVQVIETKKQSAPSNISTTDEPASGGCGYINGVSTDMEYSYADRDDWMSCYNHRIEVSAGIYIVRYKATANSIASDAVEVLVMKGRHVKPDTPTAVFDGATHILHNVENGMLYTINGGASWSKIGNISYQFTDKEINHLAGVGVLYLKRVKDGVESDVQMIPIVRNVAPHGVKTHSTDGRSGKITGVDSTMQYKKSGSSKWIDIYSTQIDGLEAGKYDIRRKGINTYIESEAITVTVEKEHHEKRNTPNAKFNGYNMCLSDINGCMISFDGQNSWTSVITTDTYYANENIVKPEFGIWLFKPANENKLESDKQYIALTRQSTPGGISAVSASPSVLGKISGIDSSMQVRSALQSNWTDVITNEVVLPAGIYYVRRKGIGLSLPSTSVEVVINAVPDNTNRSSSTVVTKPDTSSSEVVVEKTSSSSSSSSGIIVERTSSSSEKKSEIVVEHKENNSSSEKEVVQEENLSESLIMAEELLSEESEAEGEVDVVKEEVTASTGEKGWESITSTFEEATSPVVVELNLQTEVPAEVFEQAAETNTPLVLAANKEAVWSIEPTDINTSLVTQPIDLGIQNDSTVIPKEKIDEVNNNPTDQIVDRTFDIKHEGDFGFKANLTIKAKNPSQGKYANLYWYKPDTGKFTFVDFALINSRNEATFKMSHASSYAVIISEKVMSEKSLDEANTAASEAIAQNTNVKTADSIEPVKNRETNVSLLIFIIIAILLLAVITGVGITIYTKMSR